MVHHKLIIFCIALPLIFGCQSGKPIFLNEPYKGMNYLQKKVAHLPIPLDAIHIENKKDIQNNYEKDKRPPEIIVQDSLYKKMILQSSQSLLSGTLCLTNLPFDLFKNQYDTTKFFPVKMMLRVADKDSEYTFYVPKRESLPGDSIDVGIVINEITIKRILGEIPESYTPGKTVFTYKGSFQEAGHWSGRKSSVAQIARIKFIMWDYEFNRPIIYGITEANSTTTLPETYLDTIFRVAAQRVFEESPFRWKKIVQ